VEEADLHLVIPLDADDDGHGAPLTKVEIRRCIGAVGRPIRKGIDVEIVGCTEDVLVHDDYH
jgi:hypothetical protein